MNKSIEVSKAFDPVTSVEYASGSVVSRTIVKKPTGTITLFAFDEGEGFRNTARLSMRSCSCSTVRRKSP